MLVCGHCALNATQSRHCRQSLNLGENAVDCAFKGSDEFLISLHHRSDRERGEMGGAA